MFVFVSADIRHSEHDVPCIVVLQMMLTLPSWARFRLVGCYSVRAPKLQLSDARVVSTDFSRFISSESVRDNKKTLFSGVCSSCSCIKSPNSMIIISLRIDGKHGQSIHISHHTCASFGPVMYEYMYCMLSLKTQILLAMRNRK